MVIFHSYVSLPEGTTVKKMVSASEFSQDCSSRIATRIIALRNISQRPRPELELPVLRVSNVQLVL